MNILIIGNGGREHALAWKVAQSSRVKRTFVAPGNAGTAREPNVSNVDINPMDFEKLITFAKEEQIELTIVGPEAPLAAGIVDAFNAKDLACFGPTQQAAQLEASKAFSKTFMQHHKIPTARYASFTDLATAKAYVAEQSFPLVIKADGLAAGKGVVIAADRASADKALNDMLSDQRFGQAGQQVVIEEFLVGEEVSFMAIVSGKHILPLASSQDHKARDNGDKGPNTGGMGAYSPAPVLNQALHDKVMHDIVEPTVNGLVADDIHYIGFLYVGLMIDRDQQPYVLEYNCRLGDPEAQVILIRLKSDLVALCQAALENQLQQQTLQWERRAALGVVLAAGGYPNDYQTGHVIHGLDTAFPKEQKIFHAGTAIEGSQITTNGGRVLCATALGETVGRAQTRAYQMIQQIHWHTMYYRTDIGYRAIAREHLTTEK